MIAEPVSPDVSLVIEFQPSPVLSTLETIVKRFVVSAGGRGSGVQLVVAARLPPKVSVHDILA